MGSGSQNPPSYYVLCIEVQSALWEVDVTLLVMIIVYEEICGDAPLVFLYPRPEDGEERRGLGTLGRKESWMRR